MQPFVAQFAGMFSTLARIVALLALAPALPAGDWPQWRGPLRTGHVPARLAVPHVLTTEPSVAWRLKISEGLASPVMAGGAVFYLDNQKGEETVHAVDAGSGAIRWSAPLDAAFTDSQSPPGPRCTPLVDDGRVYAQSCRGELRCFSAQDGKLIWRTSYVTNYGGVFIGEKGQAAGATRHGYDGAPLIDGAHLIAVAGGTNGASVICLDKVSGALVWKSRSDPASYAPPIIAPLSGHPQVVVFTVNGLMGLDPKEGRLLWRVPFKTTFGRHVTTPVVVDDMVMISSHKFGLVGTRVVAEGNRFSATPAWTNKAAAINFASPIAMGAHLYGVGPAKDLVCVEAKTGALAWSKEGYFISAAGKAHAAFLGMGENILMLTDGGQLVLLAADPVKCREVGRVQVCANTWCNPAYADGKLYLRDSRELLCINLLK